MNKKILMIIPSYRPLIGGAEIQLEGLLSHLALSKKFKFQVITRKLYNSTNIKNIKHIKCFQLNKLFSLILFFYMIKEYKKFHIMHCHTLTSPFYVCAILSLLLKKPLIVKVTRFGINSQIDEIKKSFFKYLFFKILKKKIHFVALNKYIYQELLALNIDKNKISIIGNGVNINSINKNYFTENKINFLYVGRLIERKRVDWILDLFLSIKKNKIKIFNNLSLSIVGNGPQLENLKKYISDNELNNINFYGILTGKKLDDIYRYSDIFILPSETEGMSNSLLEAISYKLCIVASNIESNSTLISGNDDGILFNSKEELYLKIISLLNEEDNIRLHARNSFLKIEDHYSFKKISHSYLNLYEKLCS